MYTDANQASTVPQIRIHKIQAAEGKTRFWPSCRDVVCVGRPWPRFSCQAKVCQLDQLCAVTQQILWLQISVKETWETQQQTHVHRCTQRLLYLQISVKETSETQQQTHVHRGYSIFRSQWRKHLKHSNKHMYTDADQCVRGSGFYCEPKRKLTFTSRVLLQLFTGTGLFTALLGFYCEPERKPTFTSWVYSFSYLQGLGFPLHCHTMFYCCVYGGPNLSHRSFQRSENLQCQC